MSAPGKFEYSSVGQDRSLYRPNFQMERSSSFRDTVDMSSHPNMLRNTSPLTQNDVLDFFQCLRFDPKVVAADHKSIRQGDFKRHVNIALGMLEDESPSGTLRGKPIPSPIPEEIKRIKAGLRENSVKARERVKIFNEASSVFNKFFPSIPTKKRSRPEGFASDRSSDRSVTGSNLGKMGTKSQTVARGSDLDQQISEERSKNAVPNRRTRTSMMDSRNNAFVRQSLPVDRDKDTARLANSSAVQGEDRAPSTSVDGWEKSKLKKKRSGVKSGVSSGLGSNFALDGYREMKTGMQQKSASDFRSRLNGDSHLLRQENVNGAAGFRRSDNASQQTGLAGRSSIPRVDNDFSSLCNEKRELSTSSDKNRVNLRAVNKTNIHEEFNSVSPTLSTKINASVRGQRSGSGVPPKLSPTVHNVTSPSDWDISSCTNKPPTPSGVSNRKRTTPKRSSSPPASQGCSQRPQKISRATRRTNFTPTVSSNDEIPSPENTSGFNEIGFGFPRRSPGASPQQVKIKGESSLSTAALSESEESEQSDIKSKDKAKRFKVDEKTVQNVHKVSIPTFPLRKNMKLASGEEFGDGVRRKGRTSRGFASTRSLTPVRVEKPGKGGTGKQPRSARNGFDKTESKAGRPPSRKLSDRKAYKRSKHTSTNSTPDFLVGSDDGHEELLAAVNAVVDSAQKFSSAFWKQMEPYFRFVSTEDITYLKQQGDQTYINPSIGMSSVLDNCEEGLLRSGRDSSATPLYQRLLAALISEDGCSTTEEFELEEFGSITELDSESEFIGLDHMVEFNGHRATHELDHGDSEDDFSGFNHSNDFCNGRSADHLPVDFSKVPYGNLGIDEKIILEAQCIGIYIDPVPGISNVEDELISHDINKMEEELRDKASDKKGFISRLLKPTLETKEDQEKEFDQLGYEKLVEMAHEKYKASRRHHTAGAKNSGNKISKPAALAFVRRTLDIYHQYEDTGKSCFSDPVFRDMFVSGFSAPTEATPADGRSALPASGLQPGSSMTSQMSLIGDRRVNSSDMLQREISLLEQATEKEDTPWSNRVKRKEVLLDDVGLGNSLPNSTKGKRSDREKDGKEQSFTRNGTNKLGRPSVSYPKPERKSKAKPNDQKTTHIPTSIKISEQPRLSSFSNSTATASNGALKDTNNEFKLDEPLDLSHLQIPDGLGGPDDFDTQPQDLGSWLNIDDDALQDLDLVGLQIPMDDLSDLNMMV